MRERRRKNLAWTLLVTILISTAFSVALIDSGMGNPEVVLYVDPPEVLDVDIGDSFDIYITASDVEDLFLTEIYLSWDPPLLYTDIDSINPGDVAPYLEQIWIENVNNDEGWLHVSTGRPIGVKEGLSGTVQIAKITFLVEGEGSCDLHFYDNPDTTEVEPRLKNSAGVDMERTIEDGYFSNAPPVVEYTLTIAVDGFGTTDPAPGDYVYPEDEVVEVDAIPDSGYMLDHWDLDTVDVGDADPYFVTMDDDHTLTAYFVEITVGTIDSLIDLVEEFYDLGYIDDADIKESLLNKLYAAKAKIERSQVKTAQNILGAFIHHCEAQYGKHITSAAAETLISEAEHVINNL